MQKPPFNINHHRSDFLSPSVCIAVFFDVLLLELVPMFFVPVLSLLKSPESSNPMSLNT